MIKTENIPKHIQESLRLIRGETPPEPPTPLDSIQSTPREPQRAQAKLKPPKELPYQSVNPDGRPAECATALLSTGLFVATNGQLRQYDATTGIWEPLAAGGYADQFITRYFGYKASTHKIRETKHLATITATQSDGWNYESVNGWIPLEGHQYNYLSEEIKPIQKDNLWTYRINAKYEPDGRPVKFLDFLDSVFHNDADKEGKIKAIRQYFGLCLTPDVSNQKAMIFTGTGANGKGILFSILFDLLRDASCNISLSDIADANRAITMDGKTLAGDADLTRGSLNDGIFKKLVSGENIPVKRLYEDATTITPFAKLLFAANSLPVTKDVSAGYFRRWIIINFPNVFNSQKNRNLKAEIMEERDAILTWILGGLKEYRTDGQLFIPESSNEAVNSYKRAASSVFAFYKEECEDVEPDQYVFAKEIHDKYKSFCYEEGFNPIGRNTMLNELCSIAKATKKKAPQNRLAIYGISLINSTGCSNETDLPF